MVREQRFILNINLILAFQIGTDENRYVSSPCPTQFGGTVGYHHQYLPRMPLRSEHRDIYGAK